MTKFKGLLSRKLTSDLTQEEALRPDARSSAIRNQIYINYATESNLDRESRSVSTSSGNLNINTNQANNNQSQSQHTPDGIKSEPINNRITQRNSITPAFIMDLSTEQSHVKQRLARFYQQTAASESNNNNNNSSNSNSSNNNNNNNNHHHHHHNNNNNNSHQQQQQQQQHQVTVEPLNHAGINQQQSSHTSLTTSAAASASNSSSTVQVNCNTNNRLNTVLSSGNRITTSDHGQLNQWNDGKSHSQSVPTITSSNSNGINGNQGHVHHTSLTPSQCSLSSPPPPPDSPAMSGISSSASNSSISSPFSRQVDTETSVGGYTSLISPESGSKKRKRRPQPIPDNCKDDAYWERRKRNNESAKRSRELRRYKEQQTTMRVIYLEQDNLKLKTEVDMLRTELEKLREILFTRNNNFH